MEEKGQNAPSQEEIYRALEKRHSRKVQERLTAARVAIAGLGGLGSNVAIALARSGVGYLHLVDFDRVDLCNLNRQQYRICHLGMEKTEALRREILEINPYLTVRADCVKVTKERIPALFLEDSIICEAFDEPEQKAMLVNEILLNFPEKKLVASSGMAGYGDSNLITTRKVRQNFYLCGDGSSEPCDGYGLMAPRVALCAAHQANMIMRLILEEN